MTAQIHLPAGVMNARFMFSCSGVAHTMGFSLAMNAPDPLPPFPEAGISTAFKTSVLDSGVGMGSPYHYLGLDLTIGVDAGSALIRNQAENLAGTWSAVTIPPNCALLVQKRTSFAGRQNRGRMFIPPFMLMDPDIDAAGAMLSATRDAHQANWDQFYDALVTIDMLPRLLHQYDPALGESPRDPTIIQEFVVQSLIATQRRRLR